MILTHMLLWLGLALLFHLLPLPLALLAALLLAVCTSRAVRRTAAH